MGTGFSSRQVPGQRAASERHNNAQSAPRAEHGSTQPFLGSRKDKSQRKTPSLVSYLLLIAAPVAYSTPGNRPHLHLQHSLKKGKRRHCHTVPSPCHLNCFRHTTFSAGDSSIWRGSRSTAGPGLTSRHNPMASSLARSPCFCPGHWEASPFS